MDTVAAPGLSGDWTCFQGCMEKRRSRSAYSYPAWALLEMPPLLRHALACPMPPLTAVLLSASGVCVGGCGMGGHQADMQQAATPCRGIVYMGGRLLCHPSGTLQYAAAAWPRLLCLRCHGTIRGLQRRFCCARGIRAASRGAMHRTGPEQLASAT